MKRVGIFGGTFDPPHAGHLGVARAALRSGEVDEVWMMVSPQNPFKKEKQISSEESRLAMTALAVDSLPENERARIRVSDFETTLPKPTYTVTTLRALKDNFGDCSFKLIIGGDNLTAFSRWREPEEILRDYGLIVYPRPGDSEFDRSRMPAGCVILDDVPLFPVSSTEIRRLAADEPGRLREVLPQGVADYIIKNRMYGKR